MNNKVVQFGVIGAVGCLLGWLLGEALLAALLSSMSDEPGQAASLVSKPAPPLADVKPPELPPEMKELIEAAGGKSGEIQIGLHWKDQNDLDLICIDPTGYTIYFNQRRSTSGGELDVDQNAQPPLVSNPVENIRWLNDPPRGVYTVKVVFYTKRGGPSDFDVSIKNGNQKKDFVKQRLTSQKEVRDICQFTYPPPPTLRISAPPSITLNPAASNTMGVRLATQYCDDPVQFSMKDAPAGIKLNPATANSNDKEATLTLVADDTCKPGSYPIKLVASSGSATTEATVTLEVHSTKAVWSWWLIIVIALWTALLTVGLTIALVGGQNRYTGKPLFSTQQAIPIMLGSAAAGAVAGAAGQILFGLMSQVGILPQLGFLAGWGLLGGLVGYGVCFFIPNLAASKSTLAGVAGGFVGALAFIAVTLFAGSIAGRFLGAAMLGAAIGLMVALVELAFRSAWLEVKQGVEVRTVNLGPEPISLGSDARLNTIYVPYTEPRALKFWLDHGHFFCEDMKTRERKEVRAGEPQLLGKCVLTVRTSSKEATPASATPTIKAPPPPPSKKAATAPTTIALAPATTVAPPTAAKQQDTGMKLAPPPPPPVNKPSPPSAAKPTNTSPPAAPGIRPIKPPPPPPPPPKRT